VLPVLYLLLDDLRELAVQVSYRDHPLVYESVSSLYTSLTL
jgi:hypothetical protein